MASHVPMLEAACLGEWQACYDFLMSSIYMTDCWEGELSSEVEARYEFKSWPTNEVILE